MTCKVCNGSGRMSYPHPDDEGGMTTATGPCPECIEYQVCPQCDRDMMMEYGALLICVHCGYTYDEAENHTTANVY